MRLLQTEPSSAPDERRRLVEDLRAAHRRGRLVVADVRQTRPRSGRRPARVIYSRAVAELMLAAPGLFADAHATAAAPVIGAA